MLSVPLGNSGKVAIVDDGWDEDVLGQKWHLNINGYARGMGSRSSEPRVYLHQLILGEKSGFQIDHINGNKLDNRIENLRHVSRLQQNWNRSIRKDNVTGCTGISRIMNKQKPWRVRIYVNGKSKSLGCYQTFAEARTVWEKKIKQLHGEYAHAQH